MSKVVSGWAVLPRLRFLARVTLVDVALWMIRIGVAILVIAGTLGTLLKGRYAAAQWIDLLVFGLTIGSIYALIALGYTMVYGVLRLINFAHGDIVMTGAFAGYFMATALDHSATIESHPVFAMTAILTAAIATATLIAVLTERLAYRPFRHVRGLAPLICAIGVSLFLQQTYRGMFGAGVRSYPDANWERTPIDILGFGVPMVDVVVMLTACVAMIVLYFIVQRTRMGMAMRAVSEDAAAAAMMGIDVDKVVTFTFVLGGAMAGVAGVCYAFVFKQVFYFMGFTVGIKAFAAAVVGGIGSVPGAMLGGIFLGLVESVGPALVLDGLGIPAPYQLRDLFAFTVLILVLTFRPHGILRERMANKRA